MSVKRAYASPRRKAQARETRAAILDGAQELFVAKGYASTTIQAIADRAGVAPATVYAVFGTKAELLRRMIERAIVGDEGTVPITRRRESLEVAGEPDARRRAELDAALARSIVQRVGPIARVAQEAAASDPELTTMVEDLKAARRREMADSATILAGQDGLRVTEEEAAATLYVLYSPQVADMLMSDHGWSPRRYEAWLARMLLASVIDDRQPVGRHNERRRNTNGRHPERRG